MFFFFFRDNESVFSLCLQVMKDKTILNPEARVEETEPLVLTA